MNIKSIEWFPVYENDTRSNATPVGAIGFAGDQPCWIVSFQYKFRYDPNSRFGRSVRGLDMSFMNKPKTIEQIEEYAVRSMSIAAYKANWTQMHYNRFLGRLVRLHKKALYDAYFARGVGFVAGFVAKKFTRDMIAEFVISQGLEAAVEAYVESVIMGPKGQSQYR